MSNIDEMDELEQTSGKRAIKLQDFLILCLNHWPWFLLSLIICLGGAFLMLKRTAPTYERNTQIMIRMDNYGNPTSANTSMFYDLGINTNSTDVENEIAMFTSPDLMRHAVNRLNLNTVYQAKGRFRNPELYGSTRPVTVDFRNLPEDARASLRIDFKDNGDFTISKMVLSKKGAKKPVQFKGKTINGRLGVPVATPLGYLTVTPTPAFDTEKYNTILVSRAPVRTVSKNLASALQVTPDKKMDNVVTISFKSTSVEKAADVVNAVIDAYNQEWMLDKRLMADATSDFIDDRITVLQRELGTVDNDISSFKSKNMVPDVTAAANLYMTEATKGTGELTKLRNQYYMVKYLHEYLMKNQSQDKLLPTNIGITSSGLNELVKMYNDKVLERNSLLINSSESNPMIAQYDIQISGARQALISSAANEMANLSEQIQAQERLTGQAESRIASNPSQARYLLSVERQQKVKEELYLYLLQKREENQLNQVMGTSNVRTIRQTDGPDAPVAPRKAITMAVAFLLGLLIPGGILYLRELSVNYVRGRKDIEDMAIPFAGEIPMNSTSKNSFRNVGKHKEVAVVAVKENSRNAINEAFRVVRTNIEFMSGRNTGSKVIILTSATPGSGKTFIAYNLAKSFAIKGKRVVVLDMDMRKASLSKYLQGKSYGIADFLAGRVNKLSEITRHPEDYPGLNIIPVGTMPPNPTELLYYDRMEEMFNELRQEYDYIFVDCPPVEIVADTSIISHFADSTIFVVRAGLTALEMLPVLDSYYSKNTFPNLSLILNGTLNGSGSRFSKYGYRYSYGYSHKGGDYYHEDN